MLTAGSYVYHALQGNAPVAVSNDLLTLSTSGWKQRVTRISPFTRLDSSLNFVRRLRESARR